VNLGHATEQIKMQRIDDQAEPTSTPLSEPARRSLWVVLVVLATLGFSFAMACATPFAALAALIALDMPRRDLLALIGLAWLADQIAGYGFSGYPQTWDSFGWGMALLAAAMLAAVGAASAVSRWSRPTVASSLVVAFLTAFCIYELALYVASFVLPAGDGAFSASVVFRIFYANVLGLAVLVGAHRVALLLGLVVTQRAIGERPAVA
jgi:hypothetical protein